MPNKTICNPIDQEHVKNQNRKINDEKHNQALEDENNELLALNKEQDATNQFMCTQL